MLRILLLMVLFFIHVGCKKIPDLKNFDSKMWQSDPMGCIGERKKNIAFLNEIKADLVGISEDQLLSVMGNPDKKILEERSKKQYIYYLSSIVCARELSENVAVVVDFDALHRVVVLSTNIEIGNLK